jgi:hypothetical protein
VDAAAKFSDCLLDNIHLPNGQTFRQAGGKTGDCCDDPDAGGSCDYDCGDGDPHCAKILEEVGLDSSFGTACSTTSKTRRSVPRFNSIGSMWAGANLMF